MSTYLKECNSIFLWITIIITLAAFVNYMYKQYKGNLRKLGAFSVDSYYLLMECKNCYMSIADKGFLSSARTLSMPE